MSTTATLGDVDCHLASEENNRLACLKLELGTGRATLDELYYRFSWEAFRFFTEGQRWTAEGWVRLSSETLEQECREGPTEEALRAQPIDLDPGWVLASDADRARYGSPSQPDDPRFHGSPTLYDRNGKPVTYEVFVNQDSLPFITGGPSEAPLQSIQAQVDAACRGELRKVRWSFPQTDTGAPWDGPVRLKLAWKVLAPEDAPAEFVLHPEDPTKGLVGMHLAIKADTGRDQWLWATFEHRYNLEGPTPSFRRVCEGGRVTTMVDGKPSSESCPLPNTCVIGADGLRRTQVERLHPIPEAVAGINSRMQAVLGDKRPELGFYQLIGIQRPIAPSCAQPNDQSDPTYAPTCEKASQLPSCADCLKSCDAREGELQRDCGERCKETCTASPTPYVLANPVIEWDRQEASCMGCHGNSRAWALDPSPPESASDACFEFLRTECAYESAFADAARSRVLFSSPARCSPRAAVRQWIPLGYPSEARSRVPSTDLFWQLADVTEL
jgi:hypothetical protein